ncbi:MAG: radical SAM protein [bacterium]
MLFSVHNPWKILYWRERVEKLLRGEMPDPIVFTIDPSNKCNLSCEWCFTQDYIRENPYVLDAGLMHSLIDELAGTELQSIALCGGGEPLANPETPNAIRHIAETGKKVGLITNGTLLTDDAISAVLKCCDYIRISVDAAESETWIALHHGDECSWRNLVRGITSLAEQRQGKRPTIGISFLVCPFNYRQITDAAAYFKRLGADYMALKMTLTDYPSLRHLGYSGKAFFEEKNAELWEIFREAERLADTEFRVVYRHPGMFIKNEIKRPGHYYKKCRATPLGVSGITADGTFYCCCDRRDSLHFGRYGIEGSFRELWSGRRHFEALNSINLNECPDRCCAQETNEIIERAFVNGELEWPWTA